LAQEARALAMSKLIYVESRALVFLVFGGFGMGVVFTICPVTGRQIPTGIDTDQASFELTPAFVGRVRCPICNCDHEWSKTNAWVVTADGPAGAVAP
jgi:hypothetical protein